MLLRKLLPAVGSALFFGGFPTSADVIINELSSSNAAAILDEDGDNEDWIELFNTGATAVNLHNYGLSDDPADPYRWAFPDVEIGPGEYLLVWASGKDRAPGTGQRSVGFAREYYWDVSGDFDDFIAGSELGLTPDSRDIVSGVFEVPTNVADHYGVRIHGFILPPMSGLYTFWIASDNGGGLYLNSDGGTEIDYNDPIAWIPARQWSAPRSWHEYDSQESDPVFLEAGKFYFIAAVMKEDNGGDHLSVRWRLPDGTVEEPIPHGRIFLDEHQIHTNFSISKAGEPVQLTAPDGRVLDLVDPVALPADVSYGRTTDGAADWGFFTETTPGASNNTSTAYLGVLDPPEFSHDSGFHTDGFSLTLATDDPEAEIFYTLDGSEPDGDNVDGTEYAYMNEYRNGPLLYRSYRSFPYEAPLAIEKHQVPADGIQDINTQTGAGSDTSTTSWSIDGDEVVQSSLASNVRLMFGDTGWTDYELTLQAKKTGGREGFLIFFRADGDDYYEFNIGGWGNREHGLEKGHGGGNHAPYLPNVPGSIGGDVWYDIVIRADGSRFECWFDGDLVFEFDDDNNPNLHGQVGIGTWETQARFRNIEVRELAENGGDLLFSGLPSVTGEPRESILTTVRARAERPGYIPSPIVSHTYLVDPEIENRFTFPVISLAGNESDLFSFEDGIYVAGRAYAESGNGDNSHFMLRGMSWERPFHLTMFEPDGEVGLSQLAGVRIHGGWTRNHPQKSLRLYARGSLYGESYFEHPVFPDQPFDAYKRLLLRNSGNDWGRTMFADAMMQRLVEHLRFDTQAYRPAVLFINGEYWGIEGLRERYDKHYLARTYGADPDAVDILEFLPWQPHAVKEGTDTHFDETLDYLATQGASGPEDYEYLRTRIDLENYIDYNAAQIYLNNSDWPGNNNDFWRARRAEYDPLAPYGLDGRWRWMLFDTDFGFGNNRDVSFNLLRAVNSPTGNEFWNQPHATFLFRTLLTNPTFRNDFINRMADLMNSAFLPERVSSVIDGMQALLEPEIERHIERWGRPGSKNSWLGEINRMRTFGNQRPVHMRQHLRGEFNLSSRMLTVDVSDPAAGYVRVNTIDIRGETPGIAAEPYPWTGEYFNVPVTVTAVPAPGHRFSHWAQLLGSSQGESPTVTITLGAHSQMTAVFEETAGGPDALIHYWHFTGLSGDDIPLVPADHSILGNAVITYPGPGAGYMDDTDGSDLNLRLGQEPGEGLRVRNPSDSRQLLLTLPTTGYEQIRLSYAVRRTGNGATSEVVQYLTEPGGTWTTFGEPIVITEDYQSFSFDFSSIPDVDDNPDFQVRILFGGPNASGDSGNNRFDNIALDGVPMSGVQPPPELSAPIPPLDLGEGTTISVDLDNHFSTAGDDPLVYTATADKPDLALIDIDGSTLTLTVPSRGDVTLTVSADDTVNPAVETRFHVMIHPEAHNLANGDFRFEAWSNLQPENTYPEHMVFLQSDEDDPKLDAPLDFTYFIPHDDYNPSDTVGLPYDNEQRSRINGLDDAGISFVNTGRGRDLGGAVVALDTSLIDYAQVVWTAETLTANSRTYNIRLQYRTSINQPFIDLLDENGDPVEYTRAPTAGDAREIGPVPLPAAALGKPYVQLLWRYYYTDVRLDEIEGARDELRLDDIRITGRKPPLNAYGQWQREMFDDPDDLADPAISGLHADPLGQGITNLMRYAFDVPLGETARTGLPHLETAVDGNLVLTFFFRAAATDIHYIVEASGDLADWSETLFDSRVDPASPNGNSHLRIDVDPENGASRKFLRVRILYEAADD